MFVDLSGQDIFRDGDLRLVSNDGSTGGASGRLEVYYSFQWGTVCNDNIGANEALVACRQLGFSTWSDASAVSFFGYAYCGNDVCDTCTLNLCYIRMTLISSVQKRVELKLVVKGRFQHK